MDKIKLWTYWDRLYTRPPYIDMCIELMYDIKEFDFKLVTDQNIIQYLPNIRSDYRKIKNRKKLNDPSYVHTCHASDYIKTLLLYEHGGLYIDADTIVFPRFNELASLIHDHFYNAGRTLGYIGRRQENGYITVNFMYSVKGGPIISELKEQQEKILDESLIIESGSSFAARLLTRIINHHREEYWTESTRVAPISFKNWHLFFKSVNSIRSRDKDNLNNCFCAILYNRIFPQEFKDMCKEEILKKDWYISHMFRKAYGV